MLYGWCTGICTEHSRKLKFSMQTYFTHIAFLENATIEYSPDSVCVCVCVCVGVGVGVCLHDNSRSNRSKNMKFEHMVFKHIYGYQNNSDKFYKGAFSDKGQGQCRPSKDFFIYCYTIYWVL